MFRKFSKRLYHFLKLIATLSSGGVETYTCETCKETKKETVSAYGHNLVQSSYTAPTCKTNGEKVEKCSRCGFESKQIIVPIGVPPQLTFNLLISNSVS